MTAMDVLALLAIVYVLVCVICTFIEDSKGIGDDDEQDPWDGTV